MVKKLSDKEIMDEMVQIMMHKMFHRKLIAYGFRDGRQIITGYGNNCDCKETARWLK